MARKAKVATRATALEYFKYNPATDDDQTFNIDLALNQNWDKTKAEFERQGGEIEAVKQSVQEIEIPTSLPANGGNADTVDGLHASDFAPSTHNHDTLYTTKSHETNKSNPHGVTKADVGLGSVNNWGATTAVNDTSTTKYATASAVKQAYDKAVSALNSATQARGKTWTPSDTVRHTATIQPKFYGNNKGYYQSAVSLGRIYVPPKARVRLKLSAYTVTQGSTSGQTFYASVDFGMMVRGGRTVNIPQGSQMSFNDFSTHVDYLSFPYSSGEVGTDASAVTNAQQLDIDLDYHGSYYGDKSISFTGGWATFGVAVYTAYIHSCPSITIQICYDEVSL